MEVGSGPGWVTEILMNLGFHVEAIEPCADMIEIARQRLEACRNHHRPSTPGTVTFHCQPLEDCPLSSESCDGVLFHESLHHVIDENRGLAQVFRVLRRGGVLGVTGEGAWWPGHHELEAALEEEMVRAGTLENPYTREYLEYLLHGHGFEEIVRYHGVNGYFPVAMEQRTIKEAAVFPADYFNTYTARKPGLPGYFGPTTADPAVATRGAIEIRETRLDAANHKLFLRVELTNQGEAAWLNHPCRRGQVTLALHQGVPNTPQFREVPPRLELHEPVLPGKTLTVELSYRLPPGYQERPWFLDLVSEKAFWFVDRGSRSAEVKLPTAA
jgi:SAM-dependent methyltransferase